jgi:carboxymethylenebutenolidase
MGETIRPTASDEHRFDAYRAGARDTRKGGVVVVQEIFGVNAHIREVCDRFAADGYEAIAPALFDRVRPGVELGYAEPGIEEGRELATAVGWDGPMRDIWAAATAIQADGRVGVVGYCWGGTWAWLAGCRLDVGCVAAYYGRLIVDFLDEKPRCPVIMHFGAEDTTIPLDNVDNIRAAHPDVPIHVYEGAGHGFNCDHRAAYNPAAAALALQRTLALFAENLK